MQHALQDMNLRLWQVRRESMLTSTDPEHRTHRLQPTHAQGSIFSPTKRKQTLISAL